MFSVGYYDDSQWGLEGNFVWRPLTNGEFAIHGRNGRSGWGCPLFVVRNELNGEFVTAHLEWANNWRLSFTADQEPGAKDAALSFAVGPEAPAPLRVIAPGETVLSPVVHLGHLSGPYGVE
ncbi:hypothetical protein [Paenibacillus cymbidii]|uniref:hypothetical protein n=1 Tax=Paenibacillus cymbidii TaxID=1639034 RepID=UPI0010805A75|nr:hypothetical protein [Paenibacillus cymbidii]